MAKKKSEIADSQLQQATVALNRYIIENKLRRTPERITVLQHILPIRGRFTIADIVQIPGIGVTRGTVTNAIHFFVEAGLLLKAGMRGRFVLYQVVPRTNRRQSVPRTPFVVSLQCNSCGKVKEVRDKTSVAPLATRRFGGFTPTGGVVTIYGLCQECSEKLANQLEKKK